MKKRFVFVRIAGMAILIALAAFAGHTVFAESRIPVFGAERLGVPWAWNAYECRFTPSSPGKNATVEYPPNKWSALIGELPLDRLEGSFEIHLRCRWIGDQKDNKGGGCEINFEDTDKKDLPGGVSQSIPTTTDWREFTLTAKAPKGAVTLRYDLSSWGGGVLEIEDYRVTLVGADLSAAAVHGSAISWLNAPGGAAASSETGPNSAVAEFTDAAPFAFDAPAWDKARRYPILAADNRPAPRNGAAASFQLVWTPDALFVKYHAVDADLNFNGANRYDRDCFQFFLAPSGHVSQTGGKSAAIEPYAVSRTKDGRTSANTGAITRLTGDGWEAILKIPLQTDQRRIFPFNGLAVTFNVLYQDADSKPRERTFSFSDRDRTGASWRDSHLYVPLVFETDAALAYKPLWLGGDGSLYNVAPKFPGRINLVRASASLANIDFWDKTPEAQAVAAVDHGHDCFRFKYPADPRQRKVVLTLSPFNILAGETLDVTMDARADAGSDIASPGVSFLTQSNWQEIQAARTSPGGVGRRWSRMSYTLAVEDRFRKNLRNGRLMLDLGVQPGRTLEIRDITVTRRLPVDFDALISAPSQYSHFWSGEHNTVDFQFASGVKTRAIVSASVQDYFTDKPLISHAWTKDLPAGKSGMTWDLSALPNGFFNVRLKVRDANGGFLADRELYVSKGVRDTRASAFSGIFMTSNVDVTAPKSVPETIAMLRGLGVGMAQWADVHLFDSEGGDLPGDQLGLIRAFHKAGFETGFTVPQAGTHDIGRNWGPDELAPYYDRFLTKTRGLFSHLSFSNEPNLNEGWNPEPDGREWAIYNRGFYNSVKKNAPGSRPILGSFNDFPVDYIKTAATENRDSFADGVVGLHLYGLQPNGAGFQDLLGNRRLLDQAHSGWDVWDTESGLVYYSFQGILDLQSKKAPMLLCAGISRSYFFDQWDLIFPSGDSTPLMPMEAFKNQFYQDSTPVGRVTSADGKAHVYLFKRADGVGTAAFWNTSQDPATVSLPIHGAGALFDVFGNPLRALPRGKAPIVLKDRFVRYARGVDLAALMKTPSFIAAFKSARSKPRRDAEYQAQVFLSLPSASKAFDREITVGQPSHIALSLHNAGATPKTLTLSGGDAMGGLRVTFENGGRFLLKPGETRIASVEIQAAKSLERTPFLVTGALDDGLKALPLVFTVKTTPPVDVHGYSRAIEITNNGGASVDVKVVASKPEFFFQPSIVNETLPSSMSATAPLRIAPNPSYQSNFNHVNMPDFYSLDVTSTTATYTQDGTCTLFVPAPEESAPVDFANLPYTAVPDRPSPDQFQAAYKLSWAPGGLRIVARVHDPTPVQDGETGSLRSGGDCMIVALDPNDGPAPSAFGANYQECGFADSHHAPASYIWDGRYGLESSKPFPEAVNKIDRDATFIYYDITIPETLLFHTGGENAGMSIAFIDRGSDGTSQIIALGDGVFPVRAPAKMGLLLNGK